MASFAKSAYFRSVFFWLILVGVHLAVLGSSCLQPLENNAHDAFIRNRKLPVDPNIVIIEIAEDSLQSIGRWPWPRHYHAVLTHILNTWGARAIVFDAIFSEPSESLEDKAFIEALEKSRQVYFPVVLEPDQQKKKWIHCLPEFEKNAKAVGHINAVSDADGVLRYVKPTLEYAGKSYPYLAVQVAYDYLGKPLGSASQSLPFPVDKNGELLINWAGKWCDTFYHYSYIDILSSFRDAQSGQKPLISPQDIQGKICIIGLTATGQVDTKVNPLEPAYPGPGVHATVINSILTHHFLKEAPTWLNGLFLLVIGFFGFLLFVPFRNVVSFLGGLLLAASWLALAYVMFLKTGILVSVIQPILLLTSMFVLFSLLALVTSTRERFQLYELATRDGLTGLYTIRHFKSVLSRSITAAQKISEPLSLIIIDIDDFKKVNDTYGHQAGDLVLKGISQCILKSTRYQRSLAEADIVARYGGEEIIVMLHKAALKNVSKIVGERIRTSVEQCSFDYNGKEIKVTVSLGISTLNPQDTLETLISRADAALYHAKRSGKNQVCTKEISN